MLRSFKWFSLGSESTVVIKPHSDQQSLSLVFLVFGSLGEAVTPASQVMKVMFSKAEEEKKN